MAENKCEGKCQTCQRKIEVLEQFEETEINPERIANYLGAELITESWGWSIKLGKTELLGIFDIPQGRIVRTPLKKGLKKDLSVFGVLLNANKVTLERLKVHGTKKEKIIKHVVFSTAEGFYLAVSDDKDITIANC